MSCKECAYYVARHPQRYYCGYYNQDFIILVDDDLEICSHFEEADE